MLNKIEEGETRSAYAISLSTAAQVAVIGLFGLAMLTALYVTRGITVPVCLALIIGTILGPIVSRLERHRVPRVASTILIVLMLLGLLVFFALMLTAPLADWIGRAWELGNILRTKLHDFSEPLTALKNLYASLQSIGGDSSQASETIKIDTSPDANIVETAISVLTPALSQLLVFFISIIFYMIFKEDFKQTAVLAFANRKTRLSVLRVYNNVEVRLARFFTTFSLINIALGAAITLAMWAVGMPNALLWGVLSALLNFFPYLGPAIVTIALTVASILSYPTLAQAALPPIIYTVIHVLEGEFFTPSVLGYRMSVNPFILFLAVIFWTWMWGPIGAFLAVPITMIALTIYENIAPQAEAPALP